MAATAPGALPSPVQDATASSAAADGARPAGADDEGAESWAERQLAQAAELVDMVAWRHDLRRARVHVNAGASAILGLPPDDACIPIDAFRARIHPDDRAASRASFEQALAGSAQVEMELRFRDAAGRWRPFLTRRRLLRDAAGAPLAMIGVGIDLSARIESMHRQNQLMREFELTARAAGIGYWSAVGSSQVPRWSEQMYRLHGLPPHGPALSIGAWLERFVHAADRCEVLERIRAWLRAGDPFLEMEFRIVRTDGAVRRVLSHSRGERGADGRADIYGVLQDVTEQRAAQAALREAGVLRYAWAPASAPGSRISRPAACIGTSRCGGCAGCSRSPSRRRWPSGWRSCTPTTARRCWPKPPGQPTKAAPRPPSSGCSGPTAAGTGWRRVPRWCTTTPAARCAASA